MLVPILLILLGLPVLADTVQIHSVHPEFVKLNDGRVAFTGNTYLFYPGQIVDVKLDENHEILTIGPALFSKPSPPFIDVQLKKTFQPTVIKNYTAATDLLLTFNTNAIQGAQCYDRAHVWAYEASRNQKTELGKAWLFFSDRYIANYKFKWWFHVAPVATVVMKGEIQERILDREFAKFPMQIKIWTDKFMENKVDCRLISKYTDYSKHPGEHDCYTMRSTPYFWQPKDLDELEKSGAEKRDYVPWEIAYAYRYGFGLLIGHRPVNQ
jgi:hypothetical protein